MKKILLVSAPHSVSTTRTLLLERAGYSVTRINTIAEGIERVRKETFNLVLAGFLLTSKEQAELASAVKKVRANLPVITSHVGPSLANEDAALAPLDGPELLLRKVGELIMREHGHPDLKSEHYAFVDRFRLYVHVSDGACRLLGYDRDEIVGRRIDQLTFPESADVNSMFQRYLADGSQEGRYRLLHKDGRAVAVDYKARILEDGCLVSEWEPVKHSSNADKPTVSKRDIA